MGNPYESLPPEAFWRRAVAERTALEMRGLWSPRFEIRKNTRIVTAGSCFAQHIGRALATRGYGWQDAEPAPPFVTKEVARDFGYGIFSFRTGNIYTVRALLQWLELAYGLREEPEIWEAEGRFFDPLRPTIEPGGFESAASLRAAREATAAAMRAGLEAADVLVFTLGLTECWRNRDTGTEYAMCPGTAAGTFDPERHVFVNQGVADILSDLEAVQTLLAERAPDVRLLLTVSPVPLTATASGRHVLTATSASKALLRAAAEEAVRGHTNIDYFPSYEIITDPRFEGRFFAENKRQVRPEGVAHVMTCFFEDQAAAFGAASEEVTDESASEREAAQAAQRSEDVLCDEEMLDAFGR